MKAIILCILIGLALWSGTLKAQTITMGKQQPIRTMVCEKDVDAVAAATADATEGIPAAVEVLKKHDCGWAEALITPQRVVFSMKANRGVTVRVIEATVELEDGKKVTVYMLIDVNVEGLQST